MKKTSIICSALAICILLIMIYLTISSPQYALRAYILALKDKNYGKAYAMLSPDTQERYDLENMVRINERLMTIMNEDNSHVYWQGVMVGMQIYKDPGWWGYLLVKHKGKWKVVMRGGIPSFPYLCDCCCK